jgi:MFS family permease
VTTPRRRRVAVTVGFFAYAVLPGVWAARIPSVQDARHLSVGVLGLCLLAPAIGAVAALPAAGVLVSRWGRRRVLALAAVVMAGSLPLLAAAPAAGGFVCSLVAFGASGAVIDVALNVEAVAVEARYQRSLLAGMHGSWSLGALAGTGVGAITATAGVRPAVAFAATAAAVVVTLLGCALALPDDHAPRAGPALAWPDRRTVRIGLIVFCSLFVEATAADWSAVFLHRSVGASVASAGSGFAAFSAAMVAGRFAGDRLVDRFGAVRATRWPAVAGAVTLVLAVTTRVYAICIVGFFVAGAGTAILFPGAMVAAGRASTSVDPTRAIAGAATVGYLGWVLAPGLIGGVAALLSLPTAVGTAALFLALAAWLAGSLRPAVTAPEAAAGTPD